jgi:putative ABC transport system permease protein
MRLLTKLRLRLRSLVLPRRVDAELDEEMRLHIERQIDAYVAGGMTPAAARDAARREMGGVEHWKDQCRDARGFATFDSLRQDVRYALRMLRRNPGFTLVGVLVMSLGIGANTAVFSVVNSVLLNPLAYPDPDRIVTLSYSGDTVARPQAAAAFEGQVSAPDATDWLEQSTTFEAMAYYTTGRTSVLANGAAEYGLISRVRPDFFRAFGVAPALGRTFSRDEQNEGGGAAIVSSSYARQRFGDPTRALGQVLRIGNQATPIVGVMPEGFSTPNRADLWLPLPDSRTAHRRGNNFRAIGRLKAGVTLSQAQTEMSAIAARLAKAYPDAVTTASRDVAVTPLHRSIVGDARRMLLLMLGAVGLVLLIACANMATLLLAKATARTAEMGVRMAIGASRGRIIRQLLVEGLVQALLAGGIALIVAVWATRALVALAPGDVPRLAEAGLDGRVLLFTFLTCVLVSVLFALPPALHAARTDVTGAMGQGGGRTIAGGRSGRTREALVVLEIALSVVLLAGGALLVRSLVALNRAPLGYQPQHVMAMETTLPAQGRDRTRANDFFSGLLDDVAKLPGVVAVGAAAAPPGRVESSSSYFIDRMPADKSLRGGREAVMSVVAPGAFAALGVPIRAGRDFSAADRDGAPKVAIINETIARAAFRGQDPIGRVIHCTYDSLDPMTIVGVVGNVRQYGPAVQPAAECFMPHLQHFYNNTTLSVLVRTSGDPGNLPETVQRLARRRGPEASVRMTSMDAILAERVAAPRFRALLLGLFAGIALCLSMAGVYGVMAWTVAQRATEIGVRMALGATARSVLWLMVRRGMWLVGAGLALGLIGGAAAMRLLAGMLYDVTPGDAATHASVLVLLGVISLVAIYVPARRSIRIDPLATLRQP